ncbi:uncharacterized protein LOC122812866 isoform X2 [Protopterus annectens]|uniref:uncharacterized protein LOC122812866 isoform X2 n=1 Tax=Protopterus annectens TaxID=7888 RepID=UPI001CFC2FD0|nr:uncharacterized protein LOC122812866 isoform X2 [Protopterus annectens]
MSLLQGVNEMDPNFASYFVRYGSYTDRLVTPGRAYPRVVPVKYFHPYGWKVHLSSTNSVSQYPSFTSSAIRYGNYTDRLLPGVKVCRKIVPMKVEPNPIPNFLKWLLSETDDETPIKTTSPETQHYFTNFSKPQTQLLYDISQEDSWGYLDSKILSKFLDTEVRIPKNSTKKALHNVIPKMQAVLQVVNKQDPRFSSELVSSGSYNDKLQVGDPDEFDFLVPLEDFPKIFPTDTNDIPEYAADRDRVPVVVKQNYAFLLEDGAASLFSWNSKDVSDHMDINTYLVNPVKVMSLFKKYIRKAVKHLELTVVTESTG